MRALLTEPDIIPATMFGNKIDPALPELLGRIAMLSALLEQKVAVMATTVMGGSPNTAQRRLFSGNVKVIRKRLAELADSEIYASAAKRALASIERSQDLIRLRNQWLHMVWSQPAGETWAGYAAARDRDDFRPVRDVQWIEAHPLQLVALVSQLVGAIGVVDDARQNLVGAGADPEPVAAPPRRQHTGRKPSWSTLVAGAAVTVRHKRSNERREVNVDELLAKSLVDKRGFRGSDGVEYREFYWDIAAGTFPMTAG